MKFEPENKIEVLELAIAFIKDIEIKMEEDVEFRNQVIEITETEKSTDAFPRSFKTALNDYLNGLDGFGNLINVLNSALSYTITHPDSNFLPDDIGPADEIEWISDMFLNLTIYKPS
jgi:hypothetical protein